MATSCVVFGVSAERDKQCARETANHSASIGAEVWGVLQTLLTLLTQELCKLAVEDVDTFLSGGHVSLRSPRR